MIIKKLLANLRWGSLTQEEVNELKSLTLLETIKRPYLSPKLHKHY